MACKKRFKKNNTGLSDRKSSQVFNLIICLALSTIFISCASTAPNSAEGVVYNKNEGEVHQLTFEGESTQSYFSPINNKIIFIRKMDNKEMTQVFEKNLVDKKEKRITYNLGVNQSPQYHPFKAWVIYASTTDEQTDDQQIGCRINKNYSSKVVLSETSSCDNEPFEIYISSEDGSDIKRITKQKGSDKFPVFSKDGGSFFYVHNAGKMNQIFQFNLNTGSQKIVYTTSEILHGISVSEDFLAFSEGLGDANRLKILNLKKFDTISTLAKKSIEDVQLHPKESLALISLKVGEGNSNIYLFNFKDNCLSQLSYGNTSDLDPAFGPSLKTYFFSSNRTGKYQIYSSFIQEDLTCKKIE